MQKRENTKRKEKIILREFFRLLRGGRDYATRYLYNEAGRKVFLTGRTVAKIVQKHYNENIITDEMHRFVIENRAIKHQDLVEGFSAEFRLCLRESSFILRFLKRRK